MIVDEFHGPVGEWWAQDLSASFTTPPGEAQLRRLLELGQTVAEVLGQHGLMRCSAVRLTSPPGASYEGAQGDELVIAVAGGSVVEAVLKASRTLEGFVYPHLVALNGPGAVLDESGAAQDAKGVAWVELMTRDHHMVGVKTQSDAWLTHSLDGRPQPGVHRRNAARLEQALDDVQRALGMPLVAEEHTRFANAKGFTLHNQVYPDGEVVDCSSLLTQTP